MDLVPNTDYLVYLSYGVFKNSGSTSKTSVRGAIKPNYHLSPEGVVFKINPDTKSNPETSNSKASKIQYSAMMLAATSALIAIY